MKLEITTPEVPAVFRLKDSPPTGVTVTVPPVKMERGVGFEPVALAILDISKEVLVGVLSAWLYDMFKGLKSTHLTINQYQVKIELTEITQVIQRIKSEQKSSPSPAPKKEDGPKR